ncbi:MAG: sugar ABC transporter permease [Anaerolineae bacterium]|jgi:multiple sugar transport system permease protein|nr:sugar ABC transporter permease [Anaerolineae bacterium]
MMSQEAIVSQRAGPATAVEAAAGLRDIWWRRILFVPTIGLLILLAIVPLIFSLGVSLFNYSLGSRAIWVGLRNYINLFTDPQFWLATRITVQFTVVAVSIEVVLGILFGFVMNQRFTGMSVIRLIVFLPMMLAPFVVGLFWRFMFDQTFGIVDYLLTQLGLPAIPWLIHPFWARVAVVIVDVWQWTPFVTLLVLAGLGTVPTDLLEAATLDRASNWMKFRQIYWPYLRFPLLLALLFRSIDTLKMFDLPFILTGGGPGNYTSTLSILGYRQQIMFFNVGMAAAISWVVVIIINIVTNILVRLITPAKAEQVHTGL